MHYGIWELGPFLYIFLALSVFHTHIYVACDAIVLLSCVKSCIITDSVDVLLSYW